ncbi:hypothetical protein PN499_23850 [Kamptonema animale CS-326]|jgi:hypothetical protein|uniref:hypothetical protein n=1 Tax=Kamptonema animale TaxID=92934 RepID=UPI00232C8DE6|nr:hypothetical protein [Kamptonema animale]MDB9514237.1 hypothetical protein [Kamptonema animale CS-326]
MSAILAGTYLGLTHPTKETGFFDENTSFSPTDSLKNPVSGAMSISPIIVELTSTRSLLSTPAESVNKERSRHSRSRSPSIGPEDKI